MELRFARPRPTDVPRRERGSLTAESACVLLVFLCAVSALFAWFRMVRAEQAIQLALDKTALEISEYCYPAAAVGDAVSDGLHKTAEEKERNGEKVSLLLKAAEGLVSLGRGSAEDVYSAPEVAETLYQSICSSAAAGDGALTEWVGDALSAYGEDPKQAVLTIAAGMGKYEAAGLLSHVIAAPLCRQMVPGYLAEDDADAFLRACGVVDGLSGIDYSMSSVLPDGNEIRLCAMYELQPGGAFPWKMKIMQSASTGSWCTEGKQKTSSVWKLGALTRGKKLVSLAKKEKPGQAVKAGKGIDLYNPDTPEAVSVVSLQVFAASYAKGPGGEGGDASDYTLQEKKVKSALRTAAQKLKKSAAGLKNGEAVALDNGGYAAWSAKDVRLRLLVYIPEEAEVFSEALARIASETENETQVHIDFVRKDKALE